MNDCIFCKIARGEIPSQKEHHENDLIVSFPDINPRAPGHTLLIPAEHHTWFQDMPDMLSDQLFRVAKKVALELKRKHSADYIQLAISGEDVPHVHIHLIPRKLAEHHSGLTL